MKAFCSNLVGFNTSITPMTIFSGRVIKPYYNSSHSDVERADVESAERLVEAKFSEQDDPFEEVLTDNGFLCDSDRAIQTLGQLTSYATAHPAAQFRIHVFSILLFRKSARLMRWDRAGVIVSERIRLDKSVLAWFFFLRFSNANDMERGYDPIVTPFKFTPDLTKKILFNQLQFYADLGNVKVEDVNFFEVLLPREDNCYVIGEATYLLLEPLDPSKPGASRQGDLYSSRTRGAFSETRTWDLWETRRR